MMEKILSGWTFTRGLYVIVGIIVIVHSAIQQEWFGVAFGGYFFSMGLFAFGCAAGNCIGGNCSTDLEQKSKKPF